MSVCFRIPSTVDIIRSPAVKRSPSRKGFSPRERESADRRFCASSTAPGRRSFAHFSWGLLLGDFSWGDFSWGPVRYGAFAPGLERAWVQMRANEPDPLQPPYSPKTMFPFACTVICGQIGVWLEMLI